MKKVTQKAFTLAEIMIVLTVIGILTAIILPSARNLMPDKNLMKFKKAYNTLGIVITELVNSDKYYLDGDLGKKPDGSFVDNPKYLCQTMADVLNTKYVDCIDKIESSYKYINLCAYNGNPICTPTIDINTSKQYLDGACRKNFAFAKQIVTQDDVVFYDPVPQYHFGLDGEDEDIPAQTKLGDDSRIFTSFDHNGFDRLYKYICFDIDGIPENATESECINECPFGFGISINGKILLGKRAEQWLEKDIQQ